MDAKRDFKSSTKKTEIGAGKTKQKIIGKDCDLAASKGKFLVGKMGQAEKQGTYPTDQQHLFLFLREFASAEDPHGQTP